MELLETDLETLVDLILAKRLDSKNWTAAKPNRWTAAAGPRISAEIIHNQSATQIENQRVELRALLRGQEWYLQPSAEREEWGCNMGWAYLRPEGDQAFGVVVWQANRDIQPYEVFAHDYGFPGILDDIRPLAKGTLDNRKQTDARGGGSKLLHRDINDTDKQREVNQATLAKKEADHEAMLKTEYNLLRRYTQFPHKSEEALENEAAQFAEDQDAKEKKFKKAQGQRKTAFIKQLDNDKKAHASFGQRIVELVNAGGLKGHDETVVKSIMMAHDPMAQPQLQLHPNK